MDLNVGGSSPLTHPSEFLPGRMGLIPPRNRSASFQPLMRGMDVRMRVALPVMTHLTDCHL